MARLTTCLLLVLALFAGPALCMGGVLQHACDCGIEGDLECQHEDSCANDPCASVAPRSVQDERADLDFEASWVPAVLAGWASEPDRATWSSPPRAVQPPDRLHLPYAQSDRPLRI